MLEQHILQELEAYLELQREEMILYHESKMTENVYDYQELETDLELEYYIESNREPTLKEVLFRYIDRSGLSDPEVYKKARIDRRHFSKIRSNESYLPKKNTLIALAFALKLNREETDNLLHSAGYALSNSDENDLVIQFFLEKKIYNIHDVNEALDTLRLEPLIG